MTSLTNTLWRCHSTARALRKRRPLLKTSYPRCVTPVVDRSPVASASRLRPDRGPDGDDRGDRLQRPLRRLDPGRLGGGARPVALEPRGRADQQRECVAVVGERVGYVARREGKPARSL